MPRPCLTFAAVILVAGCGRVGYDGVGLGEGAGPVTPENPLSSRTMLVSTCSTTASTSFTLAEDVAENSRVVVRLGTREDDTTPTVVVDSRGNQYSLDASSHNVHRGTSPRVDVLSSLLTSALAVGDTITVEHGEVRALAIVVDVLPGAGALSNKVESIGEPPLDPEVSISTGGPALLYAATSAPNNPEIVGDGGWTNLADGDAACGGAPGNMLLLGSYRVAPAGTATYQTDLDDDTLWASVVVAYSL